jgi:MoxR-like ATPase
MINSPGGYFDAAKKVKPGPTGPGDHFDGAAYCFDDKGDIELAVNVALAAGRPLLVRGASGQGKSSLAIAVARRLGWRLIETVITARSTVDDLLWRTDSIRRLADASSGSGSLKPPEAYLEPGALWWALSPGTARTRGFAASTDDVPAVIPPENWPEEDDRLPAVLLIDEIDKADPDLPNALLVPLGSYRFHVPVINRVIERAPNLRSPLVIITSNDERVLPAAFERRCICLTLAPADRKRLLTIAAARCPDVSEQIRQAVVDKALQIERARPVSPAEIIDAVTAVDQLQRRTEGDIDVHKVIAFTLGVKSGG